MFLSDLLGFVILVAIMVSISNGRNVRVGFLFLSLSSLLVMFVLRSWQGSDSHMIYCVIHQHVVSNTALFFFGGAFMCLPFKPLICKFHVELS